MQIMPLYHFNVIDGSPEVDLDGTMLPGNVEAQAEGMRLAGALLAGQADNHTYGKDWRVEVTDRIGTVLFRIAISC